MAFTSFTKNTTITASEVNDNFSIRSGNWMPLGSTTLVNVGSTHNLGSDVYRWYNVYCNNAYASNAIVDCVDRSICLIDSYEISGNNSSTTRISFSINGDDYDFLEISVFQPMATLNSGLYVNGETNGSIYSHNLAALTFRDATITSTPPCVFLPFMSFGTSTGECFTYSIIRMNTKSGVPKNYQSSSFLVLDDDTLSYTIFAVSYYTNTSATLTSLVFGGSFNTGASIKIWGNT